MKLMPGTVSEILWHFTGGPLRDMHGRKRRDAPKHPVLAYKALVAILSTSQLRVGHYREVVEVSVAAPSRTRSKRESRKPITRRFVKLQSSPVCCVADIPIAHLAHHAARYGKFAIGFRRQAIIRHGFNPVFYTLPHSAVIQAVYRGVAGGYAADMRLIRRITEDIDDPRRILLDVQYDWLDDRFAVARHSIETFLAFVKTFKRSEFETIFAEREWRAVKTFHFAASDIAMVVLPRKVARSRYYKDFVNIVAPRLKLPRGLSIIAWEDLAES